MKTITINAYQYKELSDKAKEKVYHDYLTDGVDEWWFESTDEDASLFYLDIPEFNIHRNQIKIEFTDGAEETAKAILDGANGELFDLAKEWQQEVNDLFISYKDYGSYIDWLNENGITEDDYDFDDWVIEESGYQDDKESIDFDFLRQLGDYYLNFLKSEYEYFTSEGYVAEKCEANDYWFDINGNFISYE